MKALCKKPTEDPKTLNNPRKGLYLTFKVETANGFPLVIEFYKTPGILKTRCNFWLATAAGAGTKNKRHVSAIGGGWAYYACLNTENKREAAALISALRKGGITLFDEILSDYLEDTFIEDAIAAIAKCFDFGTFRIVVEHA